MNNTAGGRCFLQLSGNFQMVHIQCMCAFIVLTLYGLEIATILRTKRLHTNTNIFFLSIALFDTFMAICDFSQGIIYSTSLKYNIHATNDSDTVFFAIGFGSITLSCTHMAIVAIDRYVNIAHPFYYILNITKRRIIVVVFMVWLFWIVYCSVPLIFFRDDRYHINCISSHPPVVYFIVNVSLNLTDYFIISICYFKIANLAFKHKKATIARRLQTENMDNTINLRNNRIAAMRSVKFFVSLFGTFFAFTFPQIIATGLALLSYNVPENTIFGICILYDIHSVMNFLLYYNFNKDFADGLKTLLIDMTSCCRRRQADGSIKRH